MSKCNTGREGNVGPVRPQGRERMHEQTGKQVALPWVGSLMMTSISARCSTTRTRVTSLDPCRTAPTHAAPTCHVSSTKKSVGERKGKDITETQRIGRRVEREDGCRVGRGGRKTARPAGGV